MARGRAGLPEVPCPERTGTAGSRPGRGGTVTDGPTARYLEPIAGLDAAMWVPPSGGQLFWLRRAPALFAPARGTGRGLVRWWAIATVAPSTNVTGLNLGYQSYLNHVFHRTRLARAGHAVCMPVIVTALLALLYPVHAVLLGALVLAAWWAYWAVKERDLVWGGCAVGLAAALYPLALALGRLGAVVALGAAVGLGAARRRAAGRLAHFGAAAAAGHPLRSLDSVGGVPARASRLPQPAIHRAAPRRAACRAGRLRHRRRDRRLAPAAAGAPAGTALAARARPGTARGLAGPVRPGDRERQPSAGLHRHRRAHAAARPSLVRQHPIGS